MTYEKGNTLWKKRKRHGRLGYGLEEQKKRLIKQSFLISENAIVKEYEGLTDKEKIDLARQYTLKELGKNIDITTGGDKLTSVNVNIIDGSKH